MADPQPRALPQILGSMVDDYLSGLDRTGIAPGLRSLKPGSSVLALLESVAQSQARASQDLLNSLNANDIDQETGDRLIKAGRAENIEKRGETFASGQVTVSDSRYTKIQTRVYAGQPAPIPGSVIIYASDCSAFSGTGSMYLGRGTSNVEGPLPYSACTQVGSNYWQITLTSGTRRYHNLAESVVLAQGGDRIINAGQVVGTPQGNAVDAVLYQTTQVVTLLDGETSISGVPVVAQQSGTIGNVSSGAITYVQAPAFSGMTVTNPAVIQNGLAVEDDDHFRARIKAIRANRSRGTPQALVTQAYGIQASDEQTTVTAANLVTRANQPSTLYIDNGSGYEETTSGISQEVLIDSANGGETSFHLIYGRPVAKATIKSLRPAPYALTDGSILAIEVGGVRYEHTFSANEFRNIGNASAYEVVASVNQDTTLGFSARTINSATQVAFFSRAESNEDLAVVAPYGIDASSALTLPSGRVDTLRLYINDRLLSKDGVRASIDTNPQSDWSTLRGGETLILSVDGTSQQTYTITDADFVNASNYGLVNEANSLSAWAAVLNSKIPGVTTTVNGPGIKLTSNLGTNNRASLIIQPTSTLVVKGMFSVLSLSAQGQNNDYSLERNRGLVELTAPLSPGDRLTAGTPFTRAYLESTALTTVTLASDANLWFVVDGGGASVPVTLDATQTLTLTTSSTAPQRRITATVTLTSAAIYPFASVQVGDWLVVTDPTLFSTYVGSTGIGSWRVSRVDTLGQWVEVDVAADGLDHTVTNVGTAYGMMSFYRTSASPQHITISGGATYTVADLANTINASIKGALASCYENKLLRVTTNTYGTDGDISVIAQDLNAQALALQDSQSTGDRPHFAAIESQNTSHGTPPVFVDSTITSLNTALSVQAGIDGFGTTRRGSCPSLTWLRPYPSVVSPYRYGTNSYHTNRLSQLPLTAGDPVVLQSVYDKLGTGDRFVVNNGFHLGAESTLSITLDADQLGQSYSIPMFRRLLPDSSVAYGSAMKFLDADQLDIHGNPVSLLTSFGAGFDFSDFILYAHARGATHPSTANKSVLWRMRDFRNAIAGNVTYVAPVAPGLATNVTWTEPDYSVQIQLPSGAKRAATVATTDLTRLTTGTAGASVFLTGFKGLTLVRSGSTVTCTPTLPAGVTDHGFQGGEVVYLTSTDQTNFPSGLKTLTRVSASQVSYSEAGTTFGPTAYPTAKIAGSSSTVDFTASVQVGDYVALGNRAGLASQANLAWRITAVGYGYFVVSSALAVLSTFSNWVYPGTSTDTLIYPLDQSKTGTGSTPPTAAFLVSAVNALATSPISGTLGGDGSGQILLVSADDSAEATVALTEGLVHIASGTSDGSNYTLTTKYNVSASTIDWANEQFRLVPTTVRSIASFLNAPAISGISLSGAGIVAASRADHLQIASGTLGSTSAIQVTGGTANQIQLPVVGSATNISSKARVSVASSADLAALTQGMYVSVDGDQALPRQMGWSSLTATVAAGKLTANTGNAVWGFSNVGGPYFNPDFYIERHGRFTALTNLNSIDVSAIPVGDYLTIPSSVGQWSTLATGASNVLGAYGARHILLSDGSLLAFGGVATADYETYIVNGSAAVGVMKYSTGAGWVQKTNMTAGVAYAGACLLADGRILVAGGTSGGSGSHATAVQATYIYNPTLDTWTASGNLNVARMGHTMTLMSDGQVMATGGCDSTGAALNSFEVFNVNTGVWTKPVNTMAQARYNHKAILYGSNQMALIGGNTGSAATAGVEIMANYLTMVWAAQGPLGTARSCPACVVLANSQVLVVGGNKTPMASPSKGPTNTVELYNLGSGTATAAQSMAWRRSKPSILTLTDGRVLVAGGYDDLANTGTACEIYNPATNSWSWAAAALSVITGAPMSVQSDGSIWAFSGVTALSLSPTAAGPSTANVGTFQVVGRSGAVVWIENPNSVTERTQLACCVFRKYASAMPGDTLQVGTNLLGVANQGSFKITGIDLNDLYSFSVQGMTGVTATALGTATSLLQILPLQPTRAIMKIDAIIPSLTSSNIVNLYLVPGVKTWSTPDMYLDRVSESGGCVISALDRLDFPQDTQVGVDAYEYNTGLIGQVNRVLYGDESDRNTYPGFIAAGQLINISACLIRRIQVSLAIRIRPGADVKVKIQNAVASVVNQAGPNSIPLSDIIDAAGSVDGVISVVLLSPTYDALHDSIAVQPYETPRILDLDNDVQISIIGQ